MNEINLSEIIAGCIRRSAEHQKKLYQYFFSSMMKICLRYCHCTDDAAACYNESMRKVFSKIEQCRDEKLLLAWVKKIVINTCLTELKKRSRFEERQVSIDNDFDNKLDFPVHSNTISATEILQYVQALPPTHLLVFNLYAIEGYTHEEIGKMLKIATGTSKWYLSDARNKLKKSLTEFYKHESAPIIG